MEPRKENLRMKETIKKYGVIILITIGLFLGVGSTLKRCSDSRRIIKLEQQLGMAETARDSLRVQYNEDLEAWDYSKSLYVADNEILKENLVKYERRLDSLKNAKPKADVGVIIDTDTRIDTVYKTDTTYVDSAKRPIYEYSIKDQFKEGRATAYPDSLRLKLSLKTSLIGTIEDGRVTVTPTNKDVVVTGLEGFQVQEPKKKDRFWRGLGIGIGVGAVATGVLILAN